MQRMVSDTFTVRFAHDDGKDGVSYSLKASPEILRRGAAGSIQPPLLYLSVQKSVGDQVQLLETVQQVLGEQIDIYVEGGACDGESVMADLSNPEKVRLYADDYFVTQGGQSLDSLTFRMERRAAGREWVTLQRLTVVVLSDGQDLVRVVSDPEKLLFNATGGVTAESTQRLTFKTIRGGAVQTSSGSYATLTSATIDYQGPHADYLQLGVAQNAQYLDVRCIGNKSVGESDFALLRLTFSNGQTMTVTVTLNVGQATVVVPPVVFVQVVNPVQYVGVDEDWRMPASSTVQYRVLMLKDNAAEEIQTLRVTGVDWTVIHGIGLDPQDHSVIKVQTESGAVLSSPTQIGFYVTDQDGNERMGYLHLVPWQSTEVRPVEQKRLWVRTGATLDDLDPASDPSGCLVAGDGNYHVAELPVAAYTEAGTVYTFVSAGADMAGGFVIRCRGGDRLYTGSGTSWPEAWMPQGTLRVMCVKSGTWAVLSGSEWLRQSPI